MTSKESVLAELKAQGVSFYVKALKTGWLPMYEREFLDEQPNELYALWAILKRSKQ